MTLRKKTFLLIGVTLVGLIVALYFAAQLILVSSAQQLEEKTTLRNLEWARTALDENIKTLNAITRDYAHWDDTYQFIEDQNSTYLNSNLTESTFVGNGVNVILFFNNSHELVYGKAVDISNSQESTISQNLLQQLTTKAEFFQSRELAGVVNLPEAPMLIASHPILSSEAEGPKRGTLIMGRYLDPYEIQRLSQELSISLRILPVDHPHLERNQIHLDSKKPLQIKAMDKNKIAGYVLLTDVYENPNMVLRIDIPREIYQQSHASIDFFVKSLIIAGLIIGGIILLFLDKAILSRLARLSSNVTLIGARGEISARVPEIGNDELTNVATSINMMLAEYEQVTNRLEHIINFLPDATFVINDQKEIIAWNRAIEEMTGISKEEMLGKNNYAYSCPFYGKNRPTLIDFIDTEYDIAQIKEEYPYYDFIDRKGDTLIGEVFVPSLYNERGAYLWVTASPLFDKNGNLVGAIESIRDITTRKEALNKLTYLSLHDPLTGLYNRTYFEEEMRKLSEEDFSSAGMIICDVDGLKLVNDTMGHDAGDRLLIAAGELLKKAFQDHTKICRIGGDEFAILLPTTSPEKTEAIGQTIREIIHEYNENDPELPLSISIGCATCHKRITDLNELFKEADNNMYHEKLHRSPDTGDTVLKTLDKALESKNYVSENIDRIQYLITNVAAAMGVSERRLKELQLFAQFRDIGKVGISDKVLFKPGPLSPEEYAEMQRHCEIGARIAQTTPILVPIADWILKHHEWWNGKGYPLGLKGEEIPMECRLLTIADAYVAMTSDRPYRKAMSHDKAVTELSKRSGSQFDPNLLERFMNVLENRDHQSKIKFLNKNGA